MRILLSAYAFAPGFGSESDIGWNTAVQASRRHDVWVIASPGSKKRIEEARGTQSVPPVHITYVGIPFPFGWLYSAGWLEPVYHIAWQVAAYRVARKLHARHQFDLVHHATYGRSWTPSFMGFLGIPFIWNAGGLEKTPPGFMREMSWRGTAGETLRWLAMSLLYPVTRVTTAKRADVVITPSPVGMWEPADRVVNLAIGGLDREEVGKLGANRGSGDPVFRVVSVGRLLGWKGFGMGIKAFARLHRSRGGNAEYWIVGDGPERRYLEKLAVDTGCGECIRFFGWKNRDEAIGLMGEADVLLHPSLHEQFGYVLIEAMAMGKVCVCLDAGGPAIIVAPECGIKVRIGDPGQVVAGLADALMRLAADPGLRLSLGTAAKKRAGEAWAWDNVGAKIMEIYLGQAKRDTGSPRDGRESAT